MSVTVSLASTSASVTSASTVVPGASTFSSATSLPHVNGVNSVLLAFLLLVFKLNRAMEPGHLLRAVTACSDKVAWVLLVDNNLGSQKLAILALNSL
jgi:hypothetical protein